MRADIGEWPADDLPEGWTWSEFGDFFDDVTSSTRKVPTSKYLPAGKHRVIDQSSGTQSGWTDDDALVHPCPPPVVTFGDHTRFVRLVEHPFVQGADGMKVLRPRFDARFAYYAMEAIKLPDKGYSRHFSYLRASRFPLPPLPEQRRIVAKLDELRVRSRKAREALDSVPALLDKLKQSVLAAAFRGDLTAEWRAAQPPGSVEPASVLLDRIRAERRKRWEQANPKKKYVEPEPMDTEGLPELPEGWCWGSLREMASFANGDRGKNYPNVSEYVEHGIPFINTGHIRPDGTLSSDSMHFITREKFNELGGGKIQSGDLVYCLRGATLGKTAFVVPYVEGAIASSLVIIRPHSLDYAKYLYYFLTGPLGREEIGKYDNGSAQPNLAAASVAQYLLPIPPSREMKALCSVLDEVLVAGMTRATGIKRLCTTIDQLDQSILAKAFRGELVPQDPNDEPAEYLLARIRAESGAGGGTNGRRGRKANVADAPIPLDSGE